MDKVTFVVDRIKNTPDPDKKLMTSLFLFPGEIVSLQADEDDHRVGQRRPKVDQISLT